MPSAHAAVKDAARRYAVPPIVGILDSRFAADKWLLWPKSGVCLQCFCLRNNLIAWER